MRAVATRTLPAVMIVALVIAAPGGRQPVASAQEGPQSVTFDCLRLPQQFNVPPGVTELTVSAAGAAGADLSWGGDPGRGGTVQATLSVTPGHTLTITVGCASGFGWAAGGLGGPTSAGSSTDPTHGANGGGASGIVDGASATPLLVAGGGGGGGGTGFLVFLSGGNGGNGGITPTAGGDGTGLGAGGGGAGGASSTPAGADGDPANTGSAAGGGGGGGGGYPFGGGRGEGGEAGGGGGGGGGGGMSYTDPTFATDVTTGVASTADDGQVTLSYTGPAGVPIVLRCSGSLETYEVPDGVTGLLVTAIGAIGGDSPNGLFGGGNAGAAVGRSAAAAVTPGETLSVGVGCAGSAPSTGDFFDNGNPGGAGGFGYRSGGRGGNGDKQPLVITGGTGGAGGGGASGLGRVAGTSTQTILAAAGGGGGGGHGEVAFGACTGGDGGTADFSGGSAGTCVNAGAGGGLGAAGTGTGNGGIAGSFTLAGGGGGGGGGCLNGGGGGGGGVGEGGGGGGGGGRSCWATTGVTDVQSFRSTAYVGYPNGILLITPVFGSGAQDLTVSATATPSFTRTFTWGIAKGVDQSRQNIASGDSATFNYTVDVTHDAGTDSGWHVEGTIVVQNPNGTDVTGVDVTDTTSNGGSCTVPDAVDVTVPANGSVALEYRCTYTEPPAPAAGVNTATATWPSFGSPGTSAMGTAAFDFGSTAPTLHDASVAAADSLAGALGTVTSTDPSPTRFTYARSFTGQAGTCTDEANTATLTSAAAGTIASAAQTVRVCVGADLDVTKTATPAFTRTFAWAIAKSADKTLVKQAGGSVLVNYAVAVAETDFTDSAWQVAGTITVTNPNDWQAITVDVADTVDNGGSCAVANGTGVTVPASGSISRDYTCTYDAAPSESDGANTATVSWDAAGAFTPNGTASASAGFEFDTGGPGNPTTVNSPITVTDTHGGGTETLGTLTGTTGEPPTAQTFTYTRGLPAPAFGCESNANTAAIAETGQTSGWSVEVCGPIETGARTIGFWRNNNGQRIISGSGTSGVCDAGAWLRQYAPYQDLSPTANCTQVAAYVSAVIRGATASMMNTMLKAQMLATALDVYFSDPALGGNMIDAPGPIGNVTVDLLQVCSAITGTATCGGEYRDVSSAFGGTPSRTVSQLLADAASQSNVGGTTWYGNVRSTQELAKDAFDAINNQVVFAP